MSEKDQKMVEQVKEISAKGNHAEVKQDSKGEWVIYEVRKTKKKVR